MAMVRKMELHPLERDSPHSDVECSYSLVTHQTGERCLQLDTYGSAQRKLKGKKSQSLRLSESALHQLQAIIGEHFGSGDKKRG